jgi:hypothetical protein
LLWVSVPDDRVLLLADRKRRVAAATVFRAAATGYS